jgi:phenylpropionate dioxygenase-like ring-hydroxylating dioxygenase large terminal subunit
MGRLLSRRDTKNGMENGKSLAVTTLKPIEDPVLLNDWHVVARTSELTPGTVLARRLLGVDLVVWANPDGIHVWRDLCIHRGAKLSRGQVENDCLVCPYHGWSYASSGACVRIPSHPHLTPPVKARAQLCHLRLRYDLVWVCLGAPAGDVPFFPEWDDASYRKIPAGPYSFQAQGPRIIENFLDVGHFPYVHEGYLGDKGHPEIEDYEVEKTKDGIVARDIRIWQPNPDGTGTAGKVSYTYRALRPLAASFTKAQDGQCFTMIDIVTPVSETESLAWGIMAMNYGHEMNADELRRFQDTISLQDIPVVESQRPEMLPLDLQEELHLRSDRTAIAYRQWLRELGLSYGTS